MRISDWSSDVCSSDLWAYTGTEMYADQEPAGDLRAIARLYDELVHIVVPADSDVKTVADLRGKRVSLGDKGSGTLNDIGLILAAVDSSDQENEPFYLKPEHAREILRNRAIQAT